MGLLRGILLWASRSQKLREALPRYRFVRMSVSRFMPGEDLPDALNAAEVLREKDIASVLTHLAEQAYGLGSRVWIDMEGSAYTDTTLELFRRACEKSTNIGICLQAYLRRTAKDLEMLLPSAPAIRIVKRIG